MLFKTLNILIYFNTSTIMKNCDHFSRFSFLSTRPTTALCAFRLTARWMMSDTDANGRRKTTSPAPALDVIITLPGSAYLKETSTKKRTPTPTLAASPTTQAARVMSTWVAKVFNTFCLSFSGRVNIFRAWCMIQPTNKAAVGFEAPASVLKQEGMLFRVQ